MIQTIVTAFIAFASTNIDDIFILMTLFTQVPHSLERRSIIAGQYMGIIALILLSIAGSLIGLVVPVKYIGLLGLFPIYLGLVKIFRHLKKNESEEADDDVMVREGRGGLMSKLVGAQAFSIAAITIANGGDNIGIYIPLFAKASWPDLAGTVSVFLVLVYAWVIAAEYATSHPSMKERLKKYNHILFPAILIGLGIFIIADSGTHKLAF